ncbi:MAG: hypothetical protein N2446_03500 [Elusimicrobiales bacterium]|nr:hypothetical protein [Elusimicrobiales bacterium]
MIIETSKKISFGTDGFRGVIGGDFTYENVRKIAQGFSDFLAYKGFKNQDLQIIIGYDRRFLSEKFAKEFAVVLTNNDIKCILCCSPVTTPMISYLTLNKFKFGIMITASHNNFLYNGIKIKQNGRSILPLLTSEIELYIEKNQFVKVSRIPKRNIEEVDIKKEYVDYLKQKFDFDKIFSSIKGNIILDFMYGSAAEMYEKLFSKYKSITAIRTKRDPLFGEISSPEPKEDKLELLKKTVKEKKAVCGFAFDGDGDRVACIDENGKYLPPTIIAPLLVDYLIEHKKMSGKIVQTVSLGYLTKRIAKSKGFLFEFTPVGFKYIAERISEGTTLFGAEESGGYSWKGSIPERDGLITMMMILEMLSMRNKKLSEIVKEIEVKYGKSSFVREDMFLNKIITSKYSFAMKIRSKLPKEILSHKISEIITLDGIRVELDNDWWFLVRPSGTEPLLRIYAEADSNENVKNLIKIAKDLILPIL